ncbi:MAG: hypothetical protein H6835_04585 [Planctomycetes bacterium]|nr:hypothetical protein [Planctomycetota bacterium]
MLPGVAAHSGIPDGHRLGGARGAITPRGALALLDTNRLRTLDLTGWPVDFDWADFTAALAEREGLEVVR